MQKILTYIFDSEVYNNLSLWVKKVKISSHRISLFRFLQIFLRQMKKDHIAERASAMAFNFLLSIFPAIIFIFTVIPYVPIPDLQEKVMLALRNLLPQSIYDGAASAIHDITHIPHGGLLSFGFFFALFTATNGIMSMISAFNKCYKTVENRSYIKKVFTAMTIIFFLLMMLFMSIFFVVISKQYLNTIGLNKEFLYYFILGFKYLLFCVVFFIGISIIYYIAPAVSERWKFFSTGSLIASLLSLLFTLGFSYYINSFDSYNKLYGSIGAFMGVMLWFYAISIVLLIGFEINASLDLAKRESLKKQRPKPIGVRGT